MRRTAAALLDTYVGNRAGERILAGQIRCRHTEALQAAIWLSDLRDFTSLSDRLSAETVVDILNQYFDCQVPAIREHGGEILKFMGDGLCQNRMLSRSSARCGLETSGRWSRIPIPREWSSESESRWTGAECGPRAHSAAWLLLAAYVVSPAGNLSQARPMRLYEIAGFGTASFAADPLRPCHGQLSCWQDTA